MNQDGSSLIIEALHNMHTQIKNIHVLYRHMGELCSCHSDSIYVYELHVMCAGGFMVVYGGFVVGLWWVYGGFVVVYGGFVVVYGGFVVGLWWFMVGLWWVCGGLWWVCGGFMVGLCVVCG